VLTGRLPFTGDEVQVLAHQIFSDPIPPSRLSPVVDARIEAVIRKATQKNPADRYASMRQLFDDLGRIPDPSAEIAAKPVENRPYRPQGKLGAAVAEALGTTIGITGTRSERP